MSRRGVGDDGRAMLPGTDALRIKYQGALPALLERRTDLNVERDPHVRAPRHVVDAAVPADGDYGRRHRRHRRVLAAVVERRALDAHAPPMHCF